MKTNNSNMEKVISNFLKQFKIGLKSAENTFPAKKIKKTEKITICGMGGSALPADILKSWLISKKSRIEIKTHKSYDFPENEKKPDMAIFISYSGNTEETISSLKKIIRKDIPSFAITSGGKMLQICKKNNIPFVLIEKGIQPRLALAMQFGALVKILINCRVLKNNAEKEVLSIEKEINKKDLKKKGEKIAAKLKRKIPVIYSSLTFKNIARIWKIALNENSKIPAFSNYFPEMNHNELNGFESIANWRDKNKIFFALILRDKKDDKRILKRMEVAASLLRKKGIETELINIEGKNFLEKTFFCILLGNWVSYFLANNYGIDPTPVKMVEEFKKKLKE